MPEACYDRGVSAIQVKNVPEDVHEALRARAKAEGKTVGEVILEAIRRDLRKQAMRDWLDHLATIPRPGPRPTREQVHVVWEEARLDRRWEDDDRGR